MKNLFDYATKELSQDAFLRWFFENYESKEIGPIVIDFINEFTKDQKEGRKPLKLSLEDITKIKTFSQYDKVDVTVDVYSKQFANEGHITIAIEDKTDSYEHNQLETYNKKISCWNEYGNLSPKECVYKVFYKTSPVIDDELKRVNESGWTVFDIYSIYNFFKDKGNTTSQIFNDYVKHIIEIHDALEGASNADVSMWTLNHWKGFAKKYLNFIDTDNNSKEEYIWVSDYQGKYYTVNYQRCLPGSKDAASLEIFIRNKNQLTATLHHSFYFGKDYRRWAVEECPEELREEKQKLREKIRDKVKALSKKDEFKNIRATKKNANKCFGKFNESVTIENKNDAKEVIVGWIDLFNKIVEEFKD